MVFVYIRRRCENVIHVNHAATRSFYIAHYIASSSYAHLDWKKPHLTHFYIMQQLPLCEYYREKETAWFTC